MYNDLMQSILTLPQNIIEFVSYSTEKLPSNSILHFFALFNKRKGIHSERLLFLYPKFTVKGANKMEKQKKSYVKSEFTIHHTGSPACKKHGIA